MTERVPSFFMLVPGPWTDSKELLSALNRRGVSADLAAHGPIKAGHVSIDVVQEEGLATAFSWGRRGVLPPEVLARVTDCTRAASIECGFLLHEAPDRVAELGRALRDCGGLLVRMEASGSSSPWEPWLEQLESGVAFQLYASAVLLVQDDDGTMFTCGMHHFDFPDAQIKLGDASEAAAWLDAFCVYQLAEQPTLMTGHAFRPNADVSKRKIERWPDHRHHPEDGRRNPYGLWHFLEPGDPGVIASTPVPVLVPSLVSQLFAAERAKGQPLTRNEVESVANDGAAIAMDPADAAKLERSRGYADIEPELAWQQWQLVREYR